MALIWWYFVEGGFMSSPEQVEGRILCTDPKDLIEGALFRRKKVLYYDVPGLAEKLFLRDVVLAARELSDLRERVKALEPYIQHKDECTMTSAVMGDGGKIVHEAKPCSCGLVKLKGDTTTHTPIAVVPQDEIVDPGGMTAAVEMARLLSGMSV